MITLKNKFPQLLLAVFTCIFFFSCQKDLNHVSVDSNSADLITKVTSSVSGFVTNENNLAVLGANVSVGGTNVITDKYGYFEVKNVQVVKNAAVVTVTNPGYFKGIKTWAATIGKSAFFRIKLIPKTNSGSINAAAGGNVTLTNGLVISLPANAVVNAATNTTYNGNINVAAFWINPAANDLDLIMPGDLRGIDDAGSLKGLTTFGMAAVELTGISGELLQIAPGKKATLTIPLPNGGATTFPSSIPLWSFEETKGLWKQEGEATKTGSAYIGEVNHFSFWNVDLPNAIVPLTFTIVDANGNPLNNIYFDIVPLNPNPSWAHITGGTDPSGYVSTYVTPNTQYDLHLTFTSTTCILSFVQTFSVGATAVNLGNAIIPAANTANITGTVKDCSNAALNNGHIIVQEANWYSSYPITNGTFNFTRPVCNVATNINIIAVDLTTLQQSTPLAITLAPGPNNAGNLQACSLITQEFISYTVNGGTLNSLTSPSCIFNYGLYGSNTTGIVVVRNGSNEAVTLSYDNTGIAQGTVQNLIKFQGTIFNDSTNILTPIGINITEYGSVGQYIAGNFSGILTGWQPPNNVYNVSCNFRVKRSY
ncbi:MAG: hypothetical protein ABI741_09645 [Ferruginibacter sp.]